MTSRRTTKQTGSGDIGIFVYDGWNLIAECSDNGTTVTIVRTYTWGLDLSGSMQGAGGVGGLLAQQQHTGTYAGLHYPLYDGNGNVMHMASPLTNLGNTVQLSANYRYQPFGETRWGNAPYSAENPFKFSTKYHDAETGLYYYGYRYYYPVTGRWPSRDPIAEEGGVNVYGFVDNDGINWWDILGREKPVRDSEGNPIPSASQGEEKTPRRGPGPKIEVKDPDNKPATKSSSSGSAAGNAMIEAANMARTFAEKRMYRRAIKEEESKCRAAAERAIQNYDGWDEGCVCCIASIIAYPDPAGEGAAAVGGRASGTIFKFSGLVLTTGKCDEVGPGEEAFYRARGRIGPIGSVEFYSYHQY